MKTKITIIALALCSACGGFPSEGSGCEDAHEASSSTDALVTTIDVTTTLSTSSTTSDPGTSDGTETGTTMPVAEESSGEATTDGSTGDPGTSEESSDGGSSDDDTTGGLVPCEDADDCEPGQVCNPSIGSFCETPYDLHHCDETCPEEDRVIFDNPFEPGCYCSHPCVLEADCDADQVCNSLIDRCILSCANGPATCPQWSTPSMTCALVDPEPPYVQMCVYSGEPA
jgi:hypothetical protein